ncbi:uncharacterized protein [Spinacia oleracea]|uniref:Reverse transcriptase zinc-binding domain-containing protein n=1 Tax=Spinacia oleracea TaxID=3562 RepID=A0ABM3R3G0_SPIOL|nr:uncharacterized protein LOC130465429 [Spinacia oleracea]
MGKDPLPYGIIIGLGMHLFTLWRMLIRIPDCKAHWFVHNIIKNGKWYLEEIQHLIPSNIKNLILAYPLSNNADEEDFIRWSYSKSGEFEITYAYHIQRLDTPPIPLSNNFSRRSIWKIKCPFKYKMLLWNCCHEILPVAENLNKRVREISPNCCKCSNANEDHIHLFRDCSQSSVLWSFIFQRIWNLHNFDFNSFYNTPWN